MRAVLYAGLGASLALAVCPGGGLLVADDYRPVNTQRPGEEPPSPEEALALMTLPEGFSATLFATEPDVRQPIAMTLDDRGRLWIAESYSYEEWERRGKDRILIFEDTDGDGRFDRRTVFWDEGNHLSGFEIGFGGVWVCDSPHLLFIPDTDANDVPDGEPHIVLDGWTLDASHNMFNGLAWGPDGWLYGRHGILADSFVGRPETPEEDRTYISCGIWRFHPVKEILESVVRGMTNPWGMDWDEHGEMFLSGNVNGHLWHVIPGAYYERMHGRGEFPHVYERLTMCAGRAHHEGANWKQDWNKDELGRKPENTLGGGHSHCGAMIYLGDNWPGRYRGSMFMCNIHGRRVNHDVLSRRGSGFLGKYHGDFLAANTPWFRGVTLLYGPDGGVFLSDWTDYGECHDSDGVHRTSGRIFKIVFGDIDAGISGRLNLAKLPDADLIAYLDHRNDWFPRHARRILQERAVAGALSGETEGQITGIVLSEKPVPVRLHALWALFSIGKLSRELAMSLTRDDDEHVRSWAVRLLCDDPDRTPPGTVLARLIEMAESDPSSLVRLYLASSLQRIPAKRRWALAAALMAHAEDAGDVNLPLMIWYGLEPSVGAEPKRALDLVSSGRIPRLKRFIARRIASDIGENAEAFAAVSALLKSAALSPNSADTALLIAGMAEALRGRRYLPMPEPWPAASAALVRVTNEDMKRDLVNLAIAFGDESVLEGLREEALAAGVLKERRQAAVEALVSARAPGLKKLLFALLEDEDLRRAAIRGLALFQDSTIPRRLVGGYPEFTPAEKDAAITTLVSRRKFATALLDAIAGGAIARDDLDAARAHQIAALNDRALSASLREHWGNVRATGPEKKRRITELNAVLRGLDQEKKPDVENGRAIFSQRCAACHQLFGEGGNLGPNLTGSDRRSLDYFLQNVLDPSAVVAADQRMSAVTLDDGQVLAGMIVEMSRDRVTVRNTAGETTVDRAGVGRIEFSDMSIMPEGLLNGLSEASIFDLYRYLATDHPPADD